MAGRTWKLALAFAAALGSSRAWPNGPYSTNGRWIVDKAGVNVPLAGVNWHGALETMVPEGLQYQSVEFIVSRIKSLGMNVVRLTYATQMVDEIFDNGGKDIPIQTAFVNALGRDNGTVVFDNVLKNNPSFNSTTTRLQVFDAVAAECAKQEIFVHLDNHASKATWCCTPFDGNSWWNDAFFSVSNWTRGLTYMATHSKAWPNLLSQSLRNELRPALNNETLFKESYNWDDWYKYTLQGAKAVADGNAEALLYLSGLDGGTNLAPVTAGTALTPGTRLFSRADFGAIGKDKLVLELHRYNFFDNPFNCTATRADLSKAGFNALDGGTPAERQFPVVLSEWGFEQNATAWKGDYPTCLERYLPEQGAGWMIWVLGGSYYLREGKQDYDESWGLLDHRWKEWRSPEHINGGLIPLVKATAEWANRSTGAQGAGGGGGGGGGGNGKPNSQPGRPESAGVFALLGYSLLLGSAATFWM